MPETPLPDTAAPALRAFGEALLAFYRQRDGSIRIDAAQMLFDLETTILRFDSLYEELVELHQVDPAELVKRFVAKLAQATEALKAGNNASMILTASRR
jgi:hypothetical protein